jgi:AsmA protein
MNKYLKYGAIALGALVLILLAIPLFINANSFRPTIESQLTEALGRKVQVGNLSLSIFSGSLTADDFSIADDPNFSTKPFLTAKSFHVGVEVWPLITSKTMNVTSLTIEKPELNLVRNQQGRWNFSTLGSGSSAPASQAKSPSQPAPAFTVGKLELKDGRATISSTGSSKPSVYDNVDMELSNLSLTTQFPAVVTANLPGGGTFKLEGKIGPLNPTDASLTPLDAKVTIKGLDLAKSGFVEPGSGVAGIVDIANTLVSTNGTARAQGTVNVTRMQLVNGGAPSGVPVDIDFVIDYVLASSTGTISQGNIRIGKAVAHLTGTFQQTGNDTVVNLKLNGESMPVGDLQAALPAVGVILPKGSSLKSGTASANLAIQGPATKGVATGNVGLYNAQLAGFDVSSGLSAITKLTGHQSSPDTTIQKFTANVRASQSGLDASAIDAVVPALGSVTGAGTVSAAGALNFNMVASVNASSVTGGIPGLKSTSTGGPMKIPFAIQGTTSDPKFIPDMGAIARSAITGAAQSQINSLTGNNPAASQIDSALGGLLGGKKKKK